MFVEEDHQIVPNGPLEITIEPSMKVKELKLKAFENYNIPIDLQNWIINDQHLNDDISLHDCGVINETVDVNLYINKKSNINQKIKVNFKLTNISEIGSDKDDNNLENSIAIEKIDDLLNEASALPFPDIIETPILAPQQDKNIELEGCKWTCTICTFINPPISLVCSGCYKEKQLSNCIESDINNDELLNEAAALPINGQEESIELKNSTWICPICTFINPPISLACSGCYQEKPLSVEEKISVSDELKIIIDENGIYNQSDVNNIIKDIIKPTTDESLIISSLSTTPSICHYMEILNLDTQNIVYNSEPFDCSICYTAIDANEGCVLRECLHIFCRDCLASTIQFSEDAEIKCPYGNGDDDNCNSILQDREIRSLVTMDVYEKYLAKSVRYAEQKIKNSFHCKTPNCEGWCVNEDNVDEFLCPVCEFRNCLICKVIHNGLNCNEYQIELNANGQVKLEAQRTNEMINQLVNTGEVMHCPTCQILITKLSGCDWLQCLSCKTEICWVTRKPRHGANGCRCGVNGVKCHPNCGNCH